MPMPRWLAKTNRRFFSSGEISRGKRPVLIHIGRSSGKVHETPIYAHPIDGGYIFIVAYGSESDWLRNILASGSATLRIEGEEVDLTSPRLISQDAARPLLPEGTKTPPGFLRVTEYLQMDILD